MRRLMLAFALLCVSAFAGQSEQDRLQAYSNRIAWHTGLRGWTVAVLVVNAEGVGYPDSIGMSDVYPGARIALLCVLSRGEYKRLGIADAKADQRVTVRHEIGHIIAAADNEHAAVLFAYLSRGWK